MVWEKTKEHLRSSMAQNVYGLWIEPLTCVKQEGDAFELEGPDRYFSAYVQQNYKEAIEKSLAEVHGKDCNVSFSKSQQSLKNSSKTASSSKKQMRLPNIPAGGSKVRTLHPRYTFKEFMVGESNILAQSACKAVTISDDSMGPCLFINSNTGLGKSHLTHAVAHQILADSPMTRLHYLTAQQFSLEMVKGITTNKMNEFKNKYHDHCDVLLIEDVHTLTGKKKTQEELNELLDTLIKSGKRVVFTSKSAPRELVGIDSEFCSRMTSGLVTSIKEPDSSTRKRIVLQKAKQQGLCLDEEFVEYFAQHIKGDVRKIESALIALRAKSQLLGGEIEKALIQEVVRSVAGVTQVLSPAVISEFVSGQFKVSLDEMRSKSRIQRLTFPRQVAMFLSRKHTENSLADIGKIFNRDHSTVLHSIKVVTNLSHRDNSVGAQLDLLSDKVKQL